MKTVQGGHDVDEKLLKTSELAEHLGVSPSTIKRWVDRDELPATRTLGGHRLIPLSGAIRFARERNLPVLGLIGLLEIETSRQVAVNDEDGVPTWEALAEALKRGRASVARELIQHAWRMGFGAVGLADDLIRPAMEHLGHEWESRSLDVYQEHRASRIVESVLIDLIRRQPPPLPEAPLALGCSPEGDLYTLPGLSCELALRELGWDVVNLGPNLPMASLGKAVRVQQPALVWVSVSHLNAPESFIAEYRAFYASVSRTGTAVVLGGASLAPELRARLVAASFGDRMAHLREFARRLQPIALTPQRPINGTTDHPATTES